MSWLKRKPKPPPKNVASAQDANARTWMPANRVLAAAYVVVVIVIATEIPPVDRNLHYSASRELDENTRLASGHLVAPKHVPLEAVFHLGREKGELEGKYLRRTVKAGEALKAEDVRSWPVITAGAAIPVELDAEPDWLLLNQGTKVEVWVGDKKEPLRAHVLAVVPSGKKWQVLVQSKDVPDGFGYPKDQPKLRILSLP
jgi:hypothetical protein